LNPDQIPLLREPLEPRPIDVCPAAAPLPRGIAEGEPAALQVVRFSDLSEDEKEEYHRLIRNYQRDLARFERKQSALLSLRIQIQQSVSRQNLPFTFECDTVYQMLVNLKKRLSPTNETRERELIIRYHRAKRAPRDHNIDDWLLELERTYSDCRKQNLVETEGTRSVRDFVHAVESVEPSFSSYWRGEFSRYGVVDLDLYSIIGAFRNWSRENPTKRPSAAAFPATLHGRTQDDNKRNRRGTDADGKGKKGAGKPDLAGKRTDCLCGDEHRFKDCKYLIPALRSSSWHPDPAKQQRVDQKLRIPKLLETVERIRKASASRACAESDTEVDECQLSSFATAAAMSLNDQ
jgi:hypothetical protein